MSEIIRSIEAKQLRNDRPQFNVGDAVNVWVKVVEGTHERLQAFEGTVIAKRNGGVRETFTVRRVASGIGVACGGFFPKPLTIKSSQVVSLRSKNKGPENRNDLQWTALDEYFGLSKIIS